MVGGDRHHAVFDADGDYIEFRDGFGRDGREGLLFDRHRGHVEDGHTGDAGQHIQQTRLIDYAFFEGRLFERHLEPCCAVAQLFQTVLVDMVAVKQEFGYPGVYLRPGSDPEGTPLMAANGHWSLPSIISTADPFAKL